MTEPTLSSQLLGLVTIFIVVFILMLLTDKNEKSDEQNVVVVIEKTEDFGEVARRNLKNSDRRFTYDTQPPIGLASSIEDVPQVFRAYIEDYDRLARDYQEEARKHDLLKKSKCESLRRKWAFALSGNDHGFPSESKKMEGKDMSVSRDMSEMEIRVLNMVMNCETFDLPIQASEIRLETGLSKRKLEEVIESLRVNFGHPIVAKKMKPNGYYLPRSEEERQAGLAPYRRQILTEQKNLAAVMNVDLEKYWGNSA
nr:MAG TPA: hypothetical protein [Caudoviricetes sp.]